MEPVAPSLDDQMQNLRRQHAAYEREGYDGHNRRSGLTTMHDLRLRARRRQERERLARRARSWKCLPVPPQPLPPPRSPVTAICTLAPQSCFPLPPEQQAALAIFLKRGQATPAVSLIALVRLRSNVSPLAFA